MSLHYSSSSPLWVRSIYLCLEADTGQAQRVFNSCGIELAEKTEKQNRVAIAKISQVWKEIVGLTNNDAFGLKVGKHFVKNATAVFTLAAVSSVDLLQATERLSAFYKMVSTGVVLNVNTDNGVLLKLSLPTQGTGVCMYAMDASLTTLIEMAKSVLKENYQNPISVKMCRPQPKDAKIYNEYFGCDVQFNCDDNSILYDDKNIQSQDHSKNPALADHLYSYLDESLKEIVHLSLAEQVIDVMETLFDDRSVKMIEVAQKMAMSERTLQRRLRKNGTNFNELNKAFKLEKSQKWLLAKQFTQGEISHKLGFSSQSNFSRFFKTETGFTPNSYIESMKSVKAS